MSIRAYYQIRLTTTTRAARLLEAQNLGRLSSPLAHEWPQVKQAPDGTYAVARVYWPDAGVDQAAYEAKSFVAPITDGQAAELVRSWTET